MQRVTLSALAERSVDQEQAFSQHEFLTRLFIRKWTFCLCVVVPTVLGLVATWLTPMTWQASTKILIRYSSSESVFLKDLIPGERVSLSGATSGEIIRSLPTLQEVVRTHDIRDADVYQSTGKVLSGDVARLFRFLSASSPEPTPADRITEIARRLQDSLQASAKTSGTGARAAPIELLGSDLTVPQSVKGDELITLTVKAFNRAKVAEMTNGLAQAFIDQYYRISAEDANRSSQFLSLLAERFEAEIQDLERHPDAAASLPTGTPAGGGDGNIVRDSPMMTTLANELATLEARLGRAQQVYREGSPEIRRQEAEIGNLRTLLSAQERLEAAKQALEQIRVRRFQALNTERLYRNRLVPISIVEPAVTPPPSRAAWITRLLTGGVTGLLIGIVLGFALVVVLGLFDQRLFTPGDIERGLKLPVLGWLPPLAARRRRAGNLLLLGDCAQPGTGSGLSQLLVRLDGMGAGGRGGAHVVAVASAGNGEGKSCLALLLAQALAEADGGKVLLIDVDPSTAGPSSRYGDGGRSGLADAGAGAALANIVVPGPIANIDLLPAGAGGFHPALGLSSRRLHQWLEEARSRYRCIIIDTPAFARGGSALVCCVAADTVLLVVRCGVSHADPARDVVRRLYDLNVTPLGVVLNFRRSFLPGFLDRQV